MKKLLFIPSAILLSLSLLIPAHGSNNMAEDAVDVSAPSAILMDAETGTVIYEKDAYAHRSPASVTKIMTMLLAAEALENGQVRLDDPVTASSNASKMGGSQIWLEEGETMSFGEMLKCVTVVSANDCCVAIAEHLSGSEEAFVKKMNEKAASLGLKDSNFTCCSGLSSSEEHYSCAYDLAIISRELLRHDVIKDYTTIWTDTVRNGEFGLTNTNKLIYHYPGATGLKTGFTNKAMHCLAASAQREGMELIAVVLGAESSAQRFDSAKALLNYGFANYSYVNIVKFCALAPVKLIMGKSDCVNISVGRAGNILIRKDDAASITCQEFIPEELKAPVEKGQKIGSVTLSSASGFSAEIPVYAGESVEKMGLKDIFTELLSGLVLKLN